MLPPVKLLLTAAVALLVLGDAVAMTAATTTTSNAFLRDAVDTSTPEDTRSLRLQESDPVEFHPDEERGTSTLTSWISSLGSAGRSSSIMKSTAAKVEAMSRKRQEWVLKKRMAAEAKMEAKAEKKAEAAAKEVADAKVALFGQKGPATWENIETWFRGALQQRTSSLDEFIIRNAGESFTGFDDFRKLLRRAGVNNDDLIENIEGKVRSWRSRNLN
uniref:RxLR effector protein n=1 Tax=Peronospora matthiolae TaxID=2874970 RepID=A0AAV1VHI8_9STRA